MDTRAQRIARIVTGGAFVLAGVSHLTFARNGFADQVPTWVPFDEDATVLVSGAAEIGMGAALIALPGEQRRIGLAVAAFLVAVFPGNLSQWRNHHDGLGLDTDLQRTVRLPFQPLMIAMVLWATGWIGRSRAIPSDSCAPYRRRTSH